MYLEVFDILPFLQKFGLSLIGIYSNIFNWFMSEYTLPLINEPISVFELMFGAGITVFLGATMVKWIIGIVM